MVPPGRRPQDHAPKEMPCRRLYGQAVLHCGQHHSPRFGDARRSRRGRVEEAPWGSVSRCAPRCVHARRPGPNRGSPGAGPGRCGRCAGHVMPRGLPRCQDHETCHVARERGMGAQASERTLRERGHGGKRAQATGRHAGRQQSRCSPPPRGPARFPRHWSIDPAQAVGQTLGPCTLGTAGGRGARTGGHSGGGRSNPPGL